MSNRISSRSYAAAGRLALLIGVDKEIVLSILKTGVQSFYRSWEVPKRSGGRRVISAPQEPLLTVQRKILGLLYQLPISDIAHGGVPKRSIITHVLPHVDSSSLFSVDVESAFDSMGFAYDCDPLLKEGRTDKQLGTDKAVLEVIEELVLTEKNRLPQGAPTSNVLFNFGCRDMDSHLLRLAKSVGGQVTRYVDNIEFSMPGPVIDPPIQRAIVRLIQEQYFRVNHKKTRYVSNGNREGVPLHITGINIIDRETRLTPSAIRHLRIALWNAGKTNDFAIYEGIRGHVFQIWGEWPPQLQGVFEKASLSLD